MSWRTKYYGHYTRECFEYLLAVNISYQCVFVPVLHMVPLLLLDLWGF